MAPGPVSTGGKSRPHRDSIPDRPDRSQSVSRKDPVPILQVAGLAPGPDCTGGKSRPHRDSIPDRPDRSQSLYRLSYSAHSL